MKYLLMIILLFSFNQARAAEVQVFLTGNMLLDRCKAHLSGNTVVNVSKGNTCAGYVAGIADAHNTFVRWEEMAALLRAANSLSNCN